MQRLGISLDEHAGLLARLRIDGDLSQDFQDSPRPQLCAPYPVSIWASGRRRRRWQSNGRTTDVRSTGVGEARAGVAGAPMQGAGLLGSSWFAPPGTIIVPIAPTGAAVPGRGGGGGKAKRLSSASCRGMMDGGALGRWAAGRLSAVDGRVWVDTADGLDRARIRTTTGWHATDNSNGRVVVDRIVAR